MSIALCRWVCVRACMLSGKMLITTMKMLFAFSVSCPPVGDRNGHSLPSPSSGLVYSGTVWLFAPLSGLLTLYLDGSIHSISNYFALMLFGYRKSELRGKVSTVLQIKACAMYCPELEYCFKTELSFALTA